MKELVNKYEPEVLWSDGDWEPSWEYWNSTDFIAWYMRYDWICSMRTIRKW